MKRIFSILFLLTYSCLSHAESQMVIKKLNESAIQFLSDRPEYFGNLNTDKPSHLMTISIVNDDKQAKIPTNDYIIDLSNVIYKTSNLGLFNIDLTGFSNFKTSLESYNKEVARKDYINRIKSYIPILEKEISIINQEITIAENFHKNGLLKVLLPINNNYKSRGTVNSHIVIDCPMHAENISYFYSTKSDRKYLIDINDKNMDKRNLSYVISTICMSVITQENEDIRQKIEESTNLFNKMAETLTDISNAYLLDRIK